jgi:ABC-2 type transport system permease protein
VTKEWRALSASPAFLVFAVLISPLVGHAFVTSVNAYVQVHSAGAAARGMNLANSLDAIVAPTFHAYNVAMAVLFPLAVIALLSGDKKRAALAEAPPDWRVLSSVVLLKFLAAIGAVVIAWIPGLIALALWRVSGGHLSAPEISSVLFGQLLRGGLMISIAILAVAVTPGPAAATILTLAFTVAIWLADVVGQQQGGLAQLLADLAPESMFRSYERGEVRLDVVGVMLVTVASNLAVAVVWLDRGRERSVRWAWTIMLLIATTVITAFLADFRGSWSFREQQPALVPMAGGGAASRASAIAPWLFYMVLPAATLLSWWRARSKLSR